MERDFSLSPGYAGETSTSGNDMSRNNQKQAVRASRNRRGPRGLGGQGGVAVQEGPGLNIRELKEMSISQLAQIGKDLGIESTTGTRKQGPAGADREERTDLCRGGARMPAGRLRVPAGTGIQLPAGAR